MAKLSIVTPILNFIILLFQRETVSLCSIPLIWQNRTFLVAQFSNGSLNKTTSTNATFRGTTAVWGDDEGNSSLWTCHYIDESSIVLRSKLKNDSNEAFQCLLYKTVNESLTYYQTLSVNDSQYIIFPQTYNPSVCEVCSGTKTELYVMFLKENLTCGCVPDCNDILFINPCRSLENTANKCDSEMVSPTSETSDANSSWSRHQTSLNSENLTTSYAEVTWSWQQSSPSAMDNNQGQNSGNKKDRLGVLITHHGAYIGYGLSGLLFFVTCMAWVCRCFRLAKQSYEKRRIRKNKVHVIPVQEKN
ncbi:uncharacterized protein LOC133192595 [Saccostrea echinata]|uniref:uncharacterized protein LOC133192595 n=1 Tax=Saccostrea echinata TaxID=191078 RepID=UPI002A82087A|nr:uncharacterized protein LOC133192595 [Saccostrea echinata]